MVRRSVHERIGLDEPTMVRAPDYELWTRALSNSCRFGVVPEPLTFYRLHGRTVTHGDPHGTFLEVCYLLVKNIIPTIERRATFDCFCRIIAWIIANEQFAVCQPQERYRLLGATIMSPFSQDFAAFREMILRGDNPALASVGRLLLVTFTAHFALLRSIPPSNINAAFLGRLADLWRRDSERLVKNKAQLAAVESARDWNIGQLLKRNDVIEKLERELLGRDKVIEGLRSELTAKDVILGEQGRELEIFQDVEASTSASCTSARKVLIKNIG